MKKHGLRLCLATGLLLLLTGCFSQSVDELYAPPRAPDDYLKLDDKINEVLNQGGEYAAPLSGELTQKVQLQDLDGDGNMEAIAFFRVSTDERPLKIYIYRQTEEDYEVAAIIEGTGTAINSVSYVDLDGHYFNLQVAEIRFCQIQRPGNVGNTCCGRVFTGYEQ